LVRVTGLDGRLEGVRIHSISQRLFAGALSLPSKRSKNQHSEPERSSRALGGSNAAGRRTPASAMRRRQHQPALHDIVSVEKSLAAVKADPDNVVEFLSNRKSPAPQKAGPQKCRAESYKVAPRRVNFTPGA